MLLKPAVVEQSAAKIGIFGTQGSGKTLTSALLALGLSKTFHKGAPVAMQDTENGSDYLVDIFKTEGVELLAFKTRAFVDMCNGLKEAEEGGICTFLVDSYTHPWQEVNETLAKKKGVKKLEFHHMDELKKIWRGWTDAMLNSQCHVIMSGRLGYVWDREEGENGAKGDLIKLGTKMKSEGEAGYEPSLLIEMEGVPSEGGRQKKTRSNTGSIIHNAYVGKDRWRTLNGRTFAFKDLNGYKAGDYKKVFEAFRPHFDRLVIGTTQAAVNGHRTSAALFDGNGDGEYAKRARQVQITLEEIEGALVALWPGQTAKEKALKALVIETVFGTRSWTAVTAKRLEDLQAGLDAVRLFEGAAKREEHADALLDAARAGSLLTMSMEQVKSAQAAAAQELEEAVL